MKQSQREIVILKPTSVFYSFLSAQLAEERMPDLELLQFNNTAYVINKGADEDAILNEIERHYPLMFSHEIKRWLGESAFNPIENSFLDFLCCFKFELHSQIVLMEETIDQGCNLLRVKPRSMLINWMRESAQEQDDSEELIAILDKVNIHQIAENGTVVIKNFEKLGDIKPFLQNNYTVIFEHEMARMNEQASSWPKVTNYKSFCRYFSVDIHSQLIHLV